MLESTVLKFMSRSIFCDLLYFKKRIKINFKRG